MKADIKSMTKEELTLYIKELGYLFSVFRSYPVFQIAFPCHYSKPGTRQIGQNQIGSAFPRRIKLQSILTLYCRKMLPGWSGNGRISP